MDLSKLEVLLNAQRSVIETIALSSDLSHQLNTICEKIETLIASEHALSSILLLEGDQLFHGASPGLDKHYCEAINGVQIGIAVGSCGTAAYLKQQVIVSDIQSHPYWADYKELAEQSKLRSCWSTPIVSSSGDVLGTFAIYYDHIAEPTPWHLELINAFTHLSSVAIEKHHTAKREMALRKFLDVKNNQLNAFLSVIPDLALIFDDQGYYVEIFGADAEMLVAPKEQLLGHQLHEIIPAEQAKTIQQALDRAIDAEPGNVEVFEYQLDVLKGACVFEARIAPVIGYDAEQPERRHVLLMARDITARKDNEHKIKQLAFYDPLTELPNRRMLLERLDHVIQNARAKQMCGALLYCDLDNFKRINDSLGHAVGDHLLRQVAERLEPIVRQDDMVARIGGDEFVILLLHQGSDAHIIEAEAQAVSKRLIEALRPAFKLDEGEYQISASIGISLISDQSKSGDEVLRCADTSMYQSKNSGGNRFTFHNPVVQSIIDHRLLLENEINKSLEQGHFEVYFQPQICLDSQKVIGAEALLRWIHPNKGMIPPDHFIPIAEQSGLIYKLQALVLEQSCALIDTLDQQSSQPHSLSSISINISAMQFKEDLATSLIDAAKTLAVAPERIKLEITESTLMDNSETIIEQMSQLNQAGFKFAIDDFGTGYSSLSYLHTFPIEELKIDRSFVAQIDTEGSEIVDTIISLAKAMKLNIVAEGIETPSQQAHLEAKHIGAAQGFLLAKPMPAKVFVSWLAQQVAITEKA